MANSLKVSGFIVLVVVLIAGFASLIPQLESPAPEELVISGELSGAELAALGEEVFNSAGAGCLACHGLGKPGLRAPDLAGIGAAAGDRVASLSAEQYLRQSLIEPCSFVVSGYDCIMPQTLQQTLGDAKLTALVAEYPTFAQPNVINIMDLFFGGDRSYVDDPLINKAYTDGASILDLGKRTELYRAAIDRVNEMAYIYPFSEQPNIYVHSKDVEIKPGLTSITETRPGDYFWK